MTPSPPDEREAIVRWLRDNNAKWQAIFEEHPNDRHAELNASIGTTIADAIEAGVHLSEQGEGYE